jgi:hypothetical protein
MRASALFPARCAFQVFWKKTRGRHIPVYPEVKGNKRSALHALRFFCALMMVSTALHSKVYRCVNRDGLVAYQGHPCPLGQNLQDRNSDPTRWSPVKRYGGACVLHSPNLPLLVNISGGDPLQLDGGAKIRLSASESGIAASLVLEAAWPGSTKAGDATSTPQLAHAAPSTNSQGNATLPKTQSSTAVPATLGGVQATRLELSGNIALHTLQLYQAGGLQNGAQEASASFAVDIMDDATRMSYGFRQTSVLMRAMRGASSVRMQLGLRRPEIIATSEPLDLRGLVSAVRALEECQQRGSGKIRQ